MNHTEQAADLAAKAKNALAGVILAINNQAAEIDRLKNEKALLELRCANADDISAQLHKLRNYLAAAGVDYQAVSAGAIQWPQKQRNV